MTLIYLGLTGVQTIRVFRVHTVTLIYLGFTADTDLFTWGPKGCKGDLKKNKNA